MHLCQLLGHQIFGVLVKLAHGHSLAVLCHSYVCDLCPLATSEHVVLYDGDQGHMAGAHMCEDGVCVRYVTHHRLQGLVPGGHVDCSGTDLGREHTRDYW